MWFDWFKKKKGTQPEKGVSKQTNAGNEQGATVYDEITNVNSVVSCYCSSLSTVCSNGAKVLKHFGNHVDQESAEEILDGRLSKI